MSMSTVLAGKSNDTEVLLLSVVVALLVASCVLELDVILLGEDCRPERGGDGGDGTSLKSMSRLFSNASFGTGSASLGRY